LKVFTLAVVALTLILSLGSILRPIQEYGVGPEQVLSLMGYFLPITLTFVLPMAALFASALVYGRFASDNELDACRASGISLLTLVYPGVALAIVVAIANLILSFHMLPYFVHLAEKSLKADAKQILFRNIQQRGYYKLPTDSPWLIYADEARPESDTLVGVVVAYVKSDRIEIYTAERARVTFNPHDKFNEVQIYMENTLQIGSEDGGAFSMEKGAISTEFGSLLSDDIKFKNINEMKRIRADLMLFHPIEKLARDTNAQFTTELLAQEIETTIGADPNNYCKLHSADKLVEFTARKIAVGDERVKLDEDIVVVESDSSGRQPPTRFRPTKAALHIEGDKLAPTLTMDLNNVLEEESGDLKMRHIIRGLIRPSNTDVRERFGTENLLDAIRRASESPTLKKGPSGVLTNLEYLLGKEIQSTLLQIRAEIHSRLVFGVGCVPMILIGIGLGIVKRGGHLLTAFGASCIPAAVLIVCIIGGKQVAENTKSTVVSGMALMWGGLGFLLLLAAVIYHKLLKN
jgi:lipopolysaccharide export LptBFGC system permease protein LptF